uniref:Protein disulfide-isomerase n=1 Tax=Chromera velia CCMP2878 TaxID=1169474 RepID=A0A0G4GES3_9ALVE|eukprot:Cvel_21547.t1-p1 / transcript=Cvel_21547.t1 / gene=Cvel_21547 / organism=Chromera_velia_CCMP2878 / gene_product=Protein disulfide-isomerase, putative / transcript_product=Protein disulfide-isomerase, putative / location=Cvel_scaffold2031:23649-28050(-) / protein_length=479 / sequence_SO=supercontig / SO=protein_coding / is_pseudo=false
MKFLSQAVCLLGLFACAWAEGEDEAVVTLTEGTFDEFVTSNPMSLIEFYAPWCGHCKRLAPEYEKAAQKLKGTFPLAKVDATVERSLADKFQIRGYPTIKFFKNGKDFEYDGGRTESTIVDWIEKKTGPAVTVVKSADELTKILGEKHVVYVGKLKSDSSDLYKTFEKVADDNRDAGTFVAFVDGGHDDSIAVHRKDEGETPATDKSEAALTEFVLAESFPLFGPINGDNYGKYVDAERDMIWACLAPSDYTKFASAIRDVAKTFRSEYSFVWLDTDEFSSHAENALGVSDFPAVVLQAKAGRYVFPSKDITGDALKSFISDVKAGKIEKSIKSEEIPESQDEAVQVIVAKAFEKMVFESEKDVFLEVYAPWCGHCKRLEPIYTEFAEAMATELPSLMVGKMDGTANESPVENFDWTGFPTIFYIKYDDVQAAKKEGKAYDPMKYNGARTVEGLKEFALKNVSPSLAKEGGATGHAEEL